MALEIVWVGRQTKLFPDLPHWSPFVQPRECDRNDNFIMWCLVNPTYTQTREDKHIYLAHIIYIVCFMLLYAAFQIKFMIELYVVCQLFCQSINISLLLNYFATIPYGFLLCQTFPLLYGRAM
jgi:hypothetical protein